MKKNNNIILNAELRSALGTGQVRRLRQVNNQIPAIVYGSGKPAQPIHLSAQELTNTLADPSAYSRILTLKLDGEEQKVVLKQVQRHPSRPRLLHIDFLRIDMNKKLTIDVPVHLLGADAAPGVKDGGILSHHLTEVEIQCLPADLPQFLELDISQLELGQSLHLSDLPLPSGIELTASLEDEEHNQPVVTIVKPYVPTAEELASELAAPEAPVTEVTTEKVEEEEEGTTEKK